MKTQIKSVGEYIYGDGRVGVNRNNIDLKVRIPSFVFRLMEWEHDDKLFVIPYPNADAILLRRNPQRPVGQLKFEKNIWNDKAIGKAVKRKLEKTEIGKSKNYVKTKAMPTLEVIRTIESLASGQSPFDLNKAIQNGDVGTPLIQESAKINDLVKKRNNKVIDKRITELELYLDSMSKQKAFELVTKNINKNIARYKELRK